MNKNWFGFWLVAISFFSSCLTNDTFNSRLQLKRDTSAMGPLIRGYDPEAIKSKDGIWYSLQNVGLGKLPVLSDTVGLSYSVWAISEKNDAINLTRIDTATITKVLSTAIAGMQSGLPHFPVGSTGRIYIPSGLAFGTTGNGSILPNTNLLFKIKTTSAIGSRHTIDTAALTTYINSVIVNDVADSTLLKNRINKDASGIRYVYDQLYGDPLTNPELFPTLSSTIEVEYKRAVINTKLDTLTSLDTTVVLNDQITAWKLILPKISVGTTFLLFVPSGYGYGGVPTETSIPANSNLVFKLKLISIH